MIGVLEGHAHHRPSLAGDETGILLDALGPPSFRPGCFLAEIFRDAMPRAVMSLSTRSPEDWLGPVGLLTICRPGATTGFDSIGQIQKEEEEELDIDLTDPDLNKAATKIQASFRGHKVRKEGQGNAENAQD
ncbi:hypothetical protein AAG570_001312 [Ranatra chinensis]|uniref:Uncharacterized protein n=1 Tax=Ranatra chinensis TaxID=642074 RepID=A0ABD0YXX8_9HEMI